MVKAISILIEQMYLPLDQGSFKKYFFRVSVPNLCMITVSLPLLAFIACVLMTIYKDFKSANHTHCNVPNIFPSISTSIGNYEPQTFIWRTAIYSHAPFRLCLIYLRWAYYSDVISGSCQFVVQIAVLLNIIENLSLIGLTHWTSTDNYPYHEFCFKTFVSTSIIYMLLCSILLSKYRKKCHMTTLERHSLKVKWKLCAVNIVSFALAAYFFIRHNKLCEPYVYSMFGFFEYIIVISNIAFHSSTVYDVKVKYIFFTTRGISIK